MEWQCTGHRPTIWELGVRIGNQLFHVVAWARRNLDGSWSWQTPDDQGVEPSRDTAIAAASKVAPMPRHEWAPDPRWRNVHRCVICGLERDNYPTPDADRLIRTALGE